MFRASSAKTASWNFPEAWQENVPQKGHDAFRDTAILKKESQNFLGVPYDKGLPVVGTDSF